MPVFKFSLDLQPQENAASSAPDSGAVRPSEAARPGFTHIQPLLSPFQDTDLQRSFHSTRLNGHTASPSEVSLSISQGSSFRLILLLYDVPTASSQPPDIINFLAFSSLTRIPDEKSDGEVAENTEFRTADCGEVPQFTSNAAIELNIWCRTLLRLSLYLQACLKRGPDGTLFWIPNTAGCHISPQNSRAYHQKVKLVRKLKKRGLAERTTAVQDSASAFHVFASSPSERTGWQPVQGPEYSRIARIPKEDESQASSAAVLCSEYNLSPSW